MNEAATIFYKELKDLFSDKEEAQQFCTFIFTKERLPFTQRADKASLAVLYQSERGSRVQKRQVYRFRFGTDVVQIHTDIKNYMTLVHDSRRRTLSTCSLKIGEGC